MAEPAPDGAGSAIAAVGADAGNESTVAQLRRRWQEAKPFLEASKARVALLSGASVVAGFAEAGALLLLVQLALAISSGDETVSVSTGPLGGTIDATVTQLLIASLVLAFVRLALNVVVAYLPARMSADSQEKLRSEALASFLGATWDLQSKERDGHLQELLMGQINRASTAVIVLADGLTAGFNLIALMVSALVLNPSAAMAIIGAVTVLFFLLRPLTRRARAIAKDRSLANLGLSESVSELVRVAEDLQVFGVNERQQALIGSRVDRLTMLTFRSQFLARLQAAIYQNLALLLLVAGLAAVYAVGTSGLASLGAIVLIMVRGLTYSQTLQTVFHRMNDVGPDMELVRGSLERFKRAQRTGGKTKIDSIARIEFDRVSFAYRPGVPVLRDVSFAIEPGEAVGVVGPSGAGKSTLVQLLLRLRQPSDGRFLVNDGVNAEEVRARDWNRLVSYVPQDSRLLRGTVADNIAFLRPVDRAAVERAARLAGIHDEIMTWVHGYDTVIDQRGDAVSGGQRQRITIARALVELPSLLILDEPTSALDLRSEGIIQDTLAHLHGQVTLIVIAHRLSTLNICDTIMVFGGGELQAFGSPQHLLESNDFYRSSVELSELR
jgi:ABC-type multidrug transport system fused ATPase/permease subunit